MCSTGVGGVGEIVISASVTDGEDMVGLRVWATAAGRVDVVYNGRAAGLDNLLHWRERGQNADDRLQGPSVRMRGQES
jgi:hypothetical protein